MGLCADGVVPQDLYSVRSDDAQAYLVAIRVYNGDRYVIADAYGFVFPACDYKHVVVLHVMNFTARADGVGQSMGLMIAKRSGVWNRFKHKGHQKGITYGLTPP